MPKCIILCSDGTGNKGGYGDDSNVYKLYKMVEIRSSFVVGKNSAVSGQIVFYDNGVGTQSNKFIRALSGGMGFGFEKNVRDLHEFLGRHYAEGDEIFLFGFSRGAATVRAFAGMIELCGLVRWDQCGQNEEIFQTRLDQAVEAYRSNNIKNPEKGSPKITKFRETYCCDPVPIHFMGIWDTVSALGFPKDWSLGLSLLFDGLSWIAHKTCFSKPNSQALIPWRICGRHLHYHYQPDKITRNVFHALAMDDERVTFHPKVWNEQAEGRTNRVEQVWFAGAHSNVGGGYPRAGISDVALHWMMVHARNHGLVFIPNALDEVAERANVHDKLYDARDGLGIYYRYAPRNLESLCHAAGTHSREGKIKPGEIKIHTSVLDRMQQSTAGYAPSFFPFRYQEVHTPSTYPPAASTTTPGQSDGDRFQWNEKVEKINRYVRIRKGLYILFAESSLLLVLLSWAMWLNPPTGMGSKSPFSASCWDTTMHKLAEWLPSPPFMPAPLLDPSQAAAPGVGCLTGSVKTIGEILNYILPEFMEPLAYYSTHVEPKWFLGFITLALILLLTRLWVIRKIDAAREIARSAVIQKSPPDPCADLFNQENLNTNKSWAARASSFFGVAMLIVIGMFGYGTIQFWKTHDKKSFDKTICDTLIPGYPTHVRADLYWNPACVTLERGKRYRLHFPDPNHLTWMDSTARATPKGWEEPVPLFEFMNRLWGRDPDSRLFKLSGAVYSDSCPVEAKRCPTLIKNFPTEEGGTFVAPSDGELLLFANDLPFTYDNNSGEIAVRILPVEQTPL